MNHYSGWKNLLILSVVLIGLLLAMPNIFGEDPALQVALDSGVAADEGLRLQTEQALAAEGIAIKSTFMDEGRLYVLFNGVEEQLRAADPLRASLGRGHVVALTLVPRTPAWMRSIGLQPMSLGLDLRGGVHFLFEVDVPAAIRQAVGQAESDFRALLRAERIRYARIAVEGDAIRMEFESREDVERAAELIADENPDFALGSEVDSGAFALTATYTEEQRKARQDFAIQQNITTLRNRVDELGVAEPLVQRQGLNRIVVQLPGVQDPTQAERILGATATLEFRMVDVNANPVEAQRTGRCSLQSRLYQERDGQPVCLNRDVIVTGEQLTDASSGFSEGQSAVFVNLDAKGARKMLETTRNNLNKPMAVVFIEQKREQVQRGDRIVEEDRTEETVISVATIRGVFSNRFQITGVPGQEATDLALLLRAGALAAPIHKVEERTVGPSLGQDNIDQGFRAVAIGFLLVVAFMIVYYRVFGVVANLALLVNIVMIVALLSMFQAALTLPGIAGIVLTVGMAVDANVLIFERIREELRSGNTPQASIHAGYEKAFSSIADANITTLIAAVVLLAFGTGPIRGFAIVLALGIATSMFTAIIGTRAVINLTYGGRNVERLAI